MGMVGGGCGAAHPRPLMRSLHGWCVAIRHCTTQHPPASGCPAPTPFLLPPLVTVSGGCTRPTPSLAAPTALVLSVWQVNALALFHLLDFGSGFDSMLLAKTSRVSGCLGLCCEVLLARDAAAVVNV